MKFNVSKEQRSWGLTAFFTGAAIAVFIAALLRIQQLAAGLRTVLALFAPFYIGFAIAYLLNPVLRFWEEKVLHKLQNPQSRRTLATVITYTLFLLLAGGTLAYLLPRLLAGIHTLATEIPHYYDTFTESTADFIKAHPSINEIYTRYSDKIQAVISQGVRAFTAYLGGLLPKLADATLQAGNALINFIIGIVISVYLLQSKEKLIAQVKKVLCFLFKKEARYEKLITVGRVTHEKTLHFITARLLDSLIVAVITYLFMAIFRVPYPLISALTVGIFNTIPYFGSWLGAIPPAAIVLITKPKMLIPYLIFTLLLEQLDGNVIGPKIQGKQLGLSALWVIFAIFLFGGLFGVVGMVLGVPAFAVIYYFVNAAVNNGLHRQGKSTDTADYAVPEDREIIEQEKSE